MHMPRHFTCSWRAASSCSRWCRSDHARTLTGPSIATHSPPISCPLLTSRRLPAPRCSTLQAFHAIGINLTEIDSNEVILKCVEQDATRERLEEKQAEAERRIQSLKLRSQGLDVKLQASGCPLRPSLPVPPPVPSPVPSPVEW